MYVVVIKKVKGGTLEVNGPYKKYEDACWFILNNVPESWLDYCEIKEMTPPEYEE